MKYKYTGEFQKYDGPYLGCMTRMYPRELWLETLKKYYVTGILVPDLKAIKKAVNAVQLNSLGSA